VRGAQCFTGGRHGGGVRPRADVHGRVEEHVPKLLGVRARDDDTNLGRTSDQRGEGAWTPMRRVAARARCTGARTSQSVAWPAPFQTARV
jgi:hypothetical protein